jgi:hypothetical protein
MSTALIVQHIKAYGGEDRVLDTDLAGWLGYADPPQIRKLINRHRKQLEEFGFISTVEINTGERGRPATENWLTDKQCLLLCTYAETANADQVRIALVEAFAQYRQGKLVPAVPSEETSILDIQARQIWVPLQRMVRQEIEPVKNDVQELKQIVLTESADIKREIREGRQKYKWKPIAQTDKLLHIDCLWKRHAGICPRCKRTVIVDEHGVLTADFEIDHNFAPWKNAITETWPLCSRCNKEVDAAEARQACQDDFHSYQKSLRAHREDLNFPLLRHL